MTVFDDPATVPAPTTVTYHYATKIGATELAGADVTLSKK